MAEVLIVSRLLQFAGVIVVFGCGAFRLYGLGVDTATTSAYALTTFDVWFWRVTTVGAVVVLLSALSLTVATTANMACVPRTVASPIAMAMSDAVLR